MFTLRTYLNLLGFLALPTIINLQLCNADLKLWLSDSSFLFSTSYASLFVELVNFKVPKRRVFFATNNRKIFWARAETIFFKFTYGKNKYAIQYSQKYFKLGSAKPFRILPTAKKTWLCSNFLYTVRFIATLSLTQNLRFLLPSLLYFVWFMNENVFLQLCGFLLFYTQRYVPGCCGLFGRNVRSFAVGNLISSVGCHTTVKQMEFYTVVAIFSLLQQVFCYVVRTCLKYF